MSFHRARCPTNRYVLINAPLPHSPGAITAIITGLCIFSARGLHTREKEAVVVDDDAITLLSNDRACSCAIVRRASVRDCAHLSA